MLSAEGYDVLSSIPSPPVRSPSALPSLSFLYFSERIIAFCHRSVPSISAQLTLELFSIPCPLLLHRQPLHFFFRSPCGQYSQNVLLRQIHHRGTELSRKRSGLSEIFYYQLVITLLRYSCIRRVGTELGRSARHFDSEAEEFCQCFRPHHDGQGIREAGSDNPSDHPFLESLPQWGCDQVPSPAPSSLPVILFWEFPEALQRTNSGQHTPQKPVRV